MSDVEQTVASGRKPATEGAPHPSASKRNLFFALGFGGCLLAICVGLLIGVGISIAGQGLEGTLARLRENFASSPPTDLDATPTVAVPTPTLTATVAVPTVAVSPTLAAITATLSASAPLEISPITFALGTTPDYQPVAVGISFQEGITAVHAIFDYQGMSKDYTWERVWYLNETEILRNAALWAGEEQGRFDYFIDAGGEALLPGRWQLELYVEGTLRQRGVFTIESNSETEAVSAMPPTATRETFQVTATATLSFSPPATTTPSTPTATPRPAAGVYQLAYSKWDGGQHNLYVADTNGNNEQLVFGRAAGPSWSPDGNYLYFFGEEGVDRQYLENHVEYVFDGISNGIVRMDASPLHTIVDSIDQIELWQDLTWKQGTARWASVSPNGQMVAFDAKLSGNYRIYFLGTDANAQYRYELIGEQGDWSPDSQKLVYRSGRDGITGIWVSRRDDSDHVLLTNNGSDSLPAWSPDGGTIAFSRDDGGNFDIYTINADGSNLQRLTYTPGPDTLPTYTPDGVLIFRTARTGQWAIWKMNSNGDGQQELISSAPLGPDWTYGKMDVSGQ
jgi:Tol biopolymer transport system component